MPWWHGQEASWSHFIHAQRAEARGGGVERIREVRLVYSFPSVPLVICFHQGFATPKSSMVLLNCTTRQGPSVQAGKPVGTFLLKSSQKKINEPNTMSSSHTEDQTPTQSQPLRKQPPYGGLDHVVPDSWRREEWVKIIWGRRTGPLSPTRCMSQPGLQLARILLSPTLFLRSLCQMICEFQGSSTPQPSF